MPTTKPPRWIEYRPVSGVEHAARNPKGHDQPGIAASMERFGYTEPVLVDERTGQLISGHGRVITLWEQEQAGAEPPEGIVVDPKRGWTVPVVRGWRAHWSC